MYGIGKYIDAEGPMELTGKVIGFLGERTKHGAPVIFKINDQQDQFFCSIYFIMCSHT
jgi:hypothetical protein